MTSPQPTTRSHTWEKSPWNSSGPCSLLPFWQPPEGTAKARKSAKTRKSLTRKRETGENAKRTGKPTIFEMGYERRATEAEAAKQRGPSPGTTETQSRPSLTEQT